MDVNIPSKPSANQELNVHNMGLEESIKFWKVKYDQLIVHNNRHYYVLSDENNMTKTNDTILEQRYAEVCEVRDNNSVFRHLNCHLY